MSSKPVSSKSMSSKILPLKNMVLKIYGIKNCSSMKKAFDQLDAQQVTYEFHDYKKHGIALDTLRQWADQVGLELLLNKKGTTWRKFSPEQQAAILASADSTVAALSEHTSLIKRPVTVLDQHVAVGLDGLQQILEKHLTPAASE